MGRNNRTRGLPKRTKKKQNKKMLHIKQCKKEHKYIKRSSSSNETMLEIQTKHSHKKCETIKQRKK